MKNVYLLVAVCSLFLSTRVQAQIVCGMSLNNHSLCSPSALLATANESSPYPILERKWTLTSVGVNYTTPVGVNQNFSYVVFTDTCKTYYLTLWSKNTNGDTCTVTDTVRAYPVPKLSPIITPSYGEPPLAISLVLNAEDCSGGIDSVGIDWGCGSALYFNYAPDTINRVYAFCGFGCISPTITVRSTSGCFFDTTLNNAVCLIDIPDAGGYVDSDTLSCPSPPTVVQYYDTSTTHMLGIWDFGDGTKSTLDTTTHIYTLPGSYIVRRIVCTGLYCDTAIIDTIVVSGPYLASYNLSLSGLCACKDTLLASIQTVGASSLSYTWGCNTGFGHIDSIVPVGTATNPTSVNLRVSYCVTDSCQIQVMLHDSLGCTTYTNLPWVYVDTPAVKFNITRQNACIDGNFCFEDLSTYATGVDSTVSLLWDFGDGTTDTVQNPCHYYASQGTYAVTVTITSSNGCSASYVDTVANDSTLNPNPVALATTGAGECQFTYSNFSAQIATWVWYFDDGGIAFPLNPVYYFTFPPYVHWGALVVTDSMGCMQSDTAYCWDFESVVDVNKEGLSVNVTPNPFREFTMIQIGGLIEAFDLTVLNLLGKKLLIKQGKPNEPLRIDRENLPAGVYVYEVKTRSGLKATGKLVVE